MIAKFGSLAVALSLVAGPTLAQAPPTPPPVYTPTSLKAQRGLPRTSDGHPDLQDVVWEAPFFGPLAMIQPRLAPTLVLPEAQARKAYDALIGLFLKSPALALDPEAGELLSATKGFPIVRGERRSRMVVLPADGRLPLTPAAVREGQGAMAVFMAIKADNPEERGPNERCLNLGGSPPIYMTGALSPRRFTQTRDHVVIHTEYGDELRLVPFAREHRPAAFASTLGDSIARWEGDTLVIETTHFLARDRIRPSPTGVLIVNPDAKVIERYTRLAKDELLYQFTIEDDRVYSQPWLAEYSLYRAGYRMYPSSCHEGNYALGNILAGARYEERAAAAAPPKEAGR